MGLTDVQWKQIKQKMKYKKEKWAKEKYNQEQWGERYGFTLKEPYTKEELEPYKDKIPEPLYEYLINVSREMFCAYYPHELTLQRLNVSPTWDYKIMVGEGGCTTGDYICTGNYKDIETDDDEDDDEDDKNRCGECGMPDPRYPRDCLKFGQVGQTFCGGSCYYKIHDNLYDYLNQWMFGLI